MLVRSAALALVMTLLATPSFSAQRLALTVADVKQTLASVLEPVVEVRLDAESARAFGAFTKENINKQVAIYVDDEVIATPVIKDPILDGVAVIMGTHMTVAQARDIAARLRSGDARIAVALRE